MYFRNFGDIYKEVGTGNSTGSPIAPRSWQVDASYDEGELITFNGSLWRVKSDIQSINNSGSFQDIYIYLDKVSDYFDIKKTTSNANLVLKKEDHKFVLIDGGTATGNITLPAANTLDNGHQFFIQNDSDFTVQIKLSDSSNLIILGIDRAVLLTLNNKNTNSWSSLQIKNEDPLSQESFNDKLIITINSTIPVSGGITPSVGSIVELNKTSGVWSLSSIDSLKDEDRTFGIITGTTLSTTEILIWGYFDLDSGISAISGELYYLGTTLGSSVPFSSLDENNAIYYLFQSFGQRKIFFNPRRISKSKNLSSNYSQVNSFKVGMAVYLGTDGVWRGTKGGVTGEDLAIGVISKVSGNNFSVITSGRLKLSEAEWREVLPDISDPEGIDTFSLNAGTIYYAITYPPTDLINQPRCIGALTNVGPGPSDSPKRAVFTAISSEEVIVSIGSELSPNRVATSTGATLTILKTSLQGITSTYTIGTPIYYDTSLQKWNKARSNSSLTLAKGIVSRNLSGETSITVALYGLITATNASDWSNIFETSDDALNGNTSNGLIPDQTYYLSDLFDGKITRFSPIFAAPVLYAISPTQAFVQLSIQALEGGENATRIVESFSLTSSTIPNLRYKPLGKEYIDVFLNGSPVAFDDFEISNKTLTINSATSGNTVEVKYFKGINISAKNNVYAKSFNNVTCESGTSFEYDNPVVRLILPFYPSSKNVIKLIFEGLEQDLSNFDLSDNIITLSDSSFIIGNTYSAAVYIYEEIIPNRSIYGYIGRKQILIESNSSKTLNEDIFIDNLRSGSYEFFTTEDPLISAQFNVKENEGSIDSFGSVIPDFATDVTNTEDNSSTFNFYESSGDVVFQNKTGNDLHLVIYRKI